MKAKKQGQYTAELTTYNKGYDSSQQEQLLGMIAMREKRALAVGRRGSSQLASMGKLKCERKHRSSVPDAFTGIVPDGHSFTCVSVFESIMRGEFEPLYSLQGMSVLETSECAAPAAAGSSV